MLPHTVLHDGGPVTTLAEVAVDPLDHRRPGVADFSRHRPHADRPTVIKGLKPSGDVSMPKDLGASLPRFRLAARTLIHDVQRAHPRRHPIE